MYIQKNKNRSVKFPKFVFEPLAIICKSLKCQKAKHQIKSKISDKEIELGNIDFSLKTLDKSNKELELEQSNYESKISFKDENLKLIRLKESVKILKENLRKKNEDKAYLDVLKNLLQDDGIKTKITN